MPLNMNPQGELFTSRYPVRNLKMVCTARRSRWHLGNKDAGDGVCRTVPYFRDLLVWEVPANALGCHHCWRMVNTWSRSIAYKHDNWPKDSESLFILSDKLFEEGDEWSSNVVHAAAANPSWFKHQQKWWSKRIDERWPVNRSEHA